MAINDEGGIYLGAPFHSVKTFGLDGMVYFNNYPVHKFLFAVRININPVSGISTEETDITFVVKNVDIGGANIDTMDVNEYNRNRMIYTKIKYDETNITWHDVADGKTMDLWEDYYQYYFADGRPGGALSGFGYDTLTIPGNNRRYAIDSIDIFQFQAGKAKKTRLEKPRITSFKHDTHDYADMSGIMELSLSFKPEWITYEKNTSIPGDILERLDLGGTPAHFVESIEPIITPRSPERPNISVPRTTSTRSSRPSGSTPLPLASNNNNSSALNSISNFSGGTPRRSTPAKSATKSNQNISPKPKKVDNTIEKFDQFNMQGGDD